MSYPSGNEFGRLMLGILIIGLTIGMVIRHSMGSSDDDRSGVLKSPERLEPRLEFIVNDNVVDTLYVYEIYG